MQRIGVKYCGGCNPWIDRSGLIRKIGALLPPGIRLVTVSNPDLWDAGLLVCGCPVACADRPEVRQMTPRWIVVRGEMVDLESVPEDRMPTVIAKKLEGLR